MKRKLSFRLSAILFTAVLLLGVMPVHSVVAAEEPSPSAESTTSAGSGSLAATNTPTPDASKEAKHAAHEAMSALNNAIWADDPADIEITSPADGVLTSATAKVNFTYTTQFNLSSLTATDMPNQLTLSLTLGNYPGVAEDSDGRVTFDGSSAQVMVGGQNVTALGQWTAGSDPAYPEIDWKLTGADAAALIASWSGKTITVKSTAVVVDPATLGSPYQSDCSISACAVLTKTSSVPGEHAVHYREDDVNYPGNGFEIRIGLPDYDFVIYTYSNAAFTVTGNPGYVFLNPKNPSLKDLPKLVDPTGQHKFLGWSNDPGVQNEVDIFSIDDIWNMDYGQWGMGSAVYAVWSGDDDQKATITVDSNGAGFPQVQYSYPRGEDWSNYFDDSSDVPEGWQQSYQDSNGVHYLLGYSVNPTDKYPGNTPGLTWDENLTLYAIWSKAYPVDAPTITFDYNRGVTGTDDIVPNGLVIPYFVTSGQPLSKVFSDLGDEYDPPTSKDGQWHGYPSGPDEDFWSGNYTLYYNFQGWSTDPGPGNKANVDLNTVVDWTGNKTVYAVWDKIEVPNADVWAKDPNELKVTSPPDATVRSLDGTWGLSYKTRYDLSMVSHEAMPDMLVIGLYALYEDPAVGINTDTLKVFVDGKDVTTSFSVLTWNEDEESDDAFVKAHGLQEAVILEVDNPALIAAWSGKLITVRAQAGLMYPDEVELPCKAEGMFAAEVAMQKIIQAGDDENDPVAVVFDNQYALDEDAEIWPGTAPYYLNIPKGKKPGKGDTTKNPKPLGALPNTGDDALSLGSVFIGLFLALVCALYALRRREA